MYINTTHYIHLSHCQQEKKTMRFTFISYTYWQQQSDGSISATTTKSTTPRPPRLPKTLRPFQPFIHSFIRPFVRWSFKWKWIWMKTYWEKWAKTECIPPKCSNKYLDWIKTHCKWTLVPEPNRRKNKLPLIGFICFVREGENEETSNCNGHSTITNGHSEESRKGKKAQPKNISWHFKDLKCMFAAVWEHNRNHNHVEEIVKIESTKLSKTNERNCSNK